MKRLFVKATIVVSLSALVVIGAVVFHWRPLLSTSMLYVTYEQESSEQEIGRVYRLLLRNVVFIKLPEHAASTDNWFAVDLSKRIVLLPNGPKRRPYLHYNHDLCIGVPLDDMKVQGDWHVVWTGKRVTWSDGRITVVLHGV